MWVEVNHDCNAMGSNLLIACSIVDEEVANEGTSIRAGARLEKLWRDTLVPIAY